MYESMRRPKLFLDDCLSIMPDIQDESIQLILSDMPYAETGNKWDRKIDLHRFFNQALRILKPNGTIALNATLRYAVDLINACPDYYKYEWVWEKDNGTNFINSRYQPMRVHELVVIFTKGRVTNGKRIPAQYFPQFTKGKPYKQMSGKSSTNWKGKPLTSVETNNSGTRHPRTVQYFTRDKEKAHSTAKPVALNELLIKSYTEPQDIVLDTCMGSASTGVACLNTNRQFVGIEINPDIYHVAVNRLEEKTQKLYDIGFMFEEEE
jgi:site-specific DNA-methyltransferase (adenine-specific)